MATTNILVWNPTGANQEGDVAYAADTLRSGGAPTGALLPSLTDNKFRYQTSIFAAAFCQMMANKGYTMSDANYANLISALNNVKTSADFLASIVTVTYASSIAFNAAQSAQFDLTLTGDVSSSTLSGQTAGQLLLFIISQDATGSRAFSWPSGVIGAGPICPQPNSTSIQLFVVRPSGAIYPVTKSLWASASGIIAQSSVGLVAISSNGTVSNAYNEIVEKVDASAGSITRTLYTAVGFSGFKVNIKKVDVSLNQINILPFGTQTIDGQSSQQIFQQYYNLTLISDGANWFII
jgi:hypothetical protein